MPDLSSHTDAAVAAFEGPAHRSAQLKALAAYCQGFRGAVAWRSVFQLVTSVGLYLALIIAIAAALNHGLYWLYGLLLIPTGLLLVRLFVFQHDCGHGSFFRSKAANDMTGRCMSLLTLIPYSLWRRSHNLHHAGSGSLDRRGAGDIDTLTVAEYKALSKDRKFWYRLYRHPLVIFVIAPPIYILFLLRFPPWQAVPFMKDYNALQVSPEGWRSVMGTNLFLLLFYGSVTALFGWKVTLLVCLPIVVMGFWFGQWLFYVQHQYEDTYWRKKGNWNYNEAALFGSSFYDLPQILHWFTGNIGFHHIHHLCPGIPNYRLQECYKGNPELAKTPRHLTLRESLKSIRLALWDEDREKLVSFREALAGG